VKRRKQAEHCVTKLLGERRVPASGRVRGDSPDLDHPTLIFEVKSRRKLPAWLEDAMGQAEASAGDGQLPVAVLHQDGCKYRDSFISWRLGAFAGYLKEGSA